jgi:hypothetical protein
MKLFFEWIKHHPRIMAFHRTSEKAVAIAVYVLVIIVEKHHHSDRDLYAIQQALRVIVFEKTPIYRLFRAPIRELVRTNLITRSIHSSDIGILVMSKN